MQPQNVDGKIKAAVYCRMARDNDAENRKAAIYCRVADKDDLTIAWHSDTLFDLAEKHGYGYHDCVEYLDNGVVGTTLDRPALNRLCADMKAGKVQAVFIRDVSRLARQPFHLLAFMDMAREFGVEVISASEGKLTPCCDNPQEEPLDFLPRGKRRRKTV
jgi:DNA invertase Pin-like site-specific DNA recombinase